MTIYTCYLYIDDYPVNASDVPFDVSVDWGDDSPLETYNQLIVDQMPQLYHQYITDDADSSYDIEVTLTNACGSSTRQTSFTPYQAISEGCDNSLDSSGANLVGSFNDQPLPSVSAAGRTISKSIDSSSNVTLRLVTDISSSLPMVVYPLVPKELQYGIFALSDNCKPSNSAAADLRGHLDSPGQVSTVLAGVELDLRYTFDSTSIATITLVGDAALVARVTNVAVGTGTTPITWAQDGSNYKAVIDVNRDLNEIRLGLSEGSTAILRSIRITPTDGSDLTGSQKVGLKLYTLYGSVDDTRTMLTAGMSGPLSFVSDHSRPLSAFEVVCDDNFKVRLGTSGFDWVEVFESGGGVKWRGRLTYPDKSLVSEILLTINATDSQGTTIGDAEYYSVGFYALEPQTEYASQVTTSFAMDPDSREIESINHYVDGDLSCCQVVESFTFSPSSYAQIVTDPKISVTVRFEIAEGSISWSPIEGSLLITCIDSLGG